MLFVIGKLKYDTDKMTLISEKCRYRLDGLIGFNCFAKEVMLWRSKKGNWLLTFKKSPIDPTSGKTLTESEAMNLLLKYDIEAYENLFGELEEA